MKLISVAQAADRLGIQERSVRDLISRGRLPAQKIGKVYVLDEADVSAFTRDPKGRGRPRKPR